MLQLLSQISAFLPAYLASPTMYAGMLLVLASNHPRERALAAWIGSVATAIVIGVVAVTGASAAGARTPGTLSGVIDVALGALLVALAIRRIFREQKETVKGRRFDFSSTEPQLLRFTVLGLLLTVTNPTSLGSFLAAAKLTVDSGLGFWQESLAMALGVFYVALPVLIPLVLVLLAPRSSRRLLKAFNDALQKYGKYIIIAIILLLGAYLIHKGIDILA